jgi:hypothetical protein
MVQSQAVKKKLVFKKRLTVTFLIPSWKFRPLF